MRSTSRRSSRDLNPPGPITLAAHLRFILGDLVRQVELIRLIGRLELDVVEEE